MKSFEISSLGLEALKNEEIIRTNGGFWHWVAGVILGGIIYDLISNPTHNAEKMQEGVDDANSAWHK